MSQTSKPRIPKAWQARRVPPALRAAAASTLVGPEAGDPLVAGRRFVQAAPSFGIDLELMFGTIDRGRMPPVGHVALAVLGAGRTAMMFVSGGSRVADDLGERVAAIELACEHLRGLGRERVRISQALPEPDQEDVVSALVASGYTHVGELAYLRRPVTRLDERAPVRELPPGVSVRHVRSLERGDADREALGVALERSYVDTSDCPELCGLRDVHDVIDSHKATGEWRADLWWLVYDGVEAHGCMLLNHSPEQGATELVYLGLSPQLRARGIGRALLERALAPAARLRSEAINCAVDRRNAPAMALYERTGFVEFSSRHALVRAF